MNEFLKVYWKKHLMLYTMLILVWGMFWYLKSDVVLFIIMVSITSVYIITRDVTRYLNNDEKFRNLKDRSKDE